MIDEPTPVDATRKVAERLQDALGEGYVVERALGAGGFAIVFLVRDVALKRRLAVKVMSPDMIASETALERFRREAETVAQLKHPNIVSLHFIGQKTDLLYLAMEFVDGGSLHDQLTAATGPMPFGRIERAVSEVASALAHAHKHGVVHRDIKPHNVLLDSESDRCLVTDFGIARTSSGSSLTATGMLIGTPAYLAPEQVTGEPADHRVDIYALGVMTYEMVTGRQPFDGPTPAAVVMRRLGGPPESASNYRDNVPIVLKQVMDRCLATDPADRFQSAGEIVEAISRVTTASSEATIAVATSTKHVAVRNSRNRRQLAWLVAGAAVILAGTVIALRPNHAAVQQQPRIDAVMIAIPGGDYVIGSDAGSSNARPAHRVTLDTFAIDAHEVTVGAYAAFADATGAAKPWEGAAPDSLVPVTSVQWAEAAAYCKWKHPPAGRLPSEIEWEAAARGRAGRAFPWGDSLDGTRANVAAAGRGRAVHIGLFPSGATPEGVNDLIGNVWEWTASPMEAYPGGAPLADNLRQMRVIRGGAFNTPNSLATSSFRSYSNPGALGSDLNLTGFRCAMTPR